MNQQLCCATRADQGGPAGSEERLWGGAPRTAGARRPGLTVEPGPGDDEAARDAGGRRDRFLATLFHELRTPLATACNALYLLKQAVTDEEQAGRALAVIDRQLALMARLVDDLLDVTRLREGKIRLERASLDLAALARQSVEDYLYFFAAHGLELRAEIAPGRLQIQGDGARLRQAIGNLLQNAAKFTPGGGRVVLALAADGCAAELRVRDTGTGFEPALRDTLFEPFEQASATLARSEGGLGLGLALVKGVVELHGGTVEARSDGPGKGAEFSVRLPLEPGTRDRGRYQVLPVTDGP